MEKQPIDKLFADKLRNHEVSPSAAAWHRLQQRTEAEQKRRTAALWWQRGTWAAAAGVVLVAGGIWISQNDSPSAQQMAVSTPKKVTNQVVLPTNSADNNRTAVATLTQTNTKIKHNAQVETATKQPVTNVNTDEAIAKTTPIVEKPNDNITPVHTPTPLPNTETAVAQTETKSTERKIELTLPEPPVQEPVTVVFNEPSEVSKAVLAKGNDNKDKRLKTTRFARVMRQLKNAKEGEKIDWNEVGFDPNPVLAKVGKSI